MVIDVSLAGLTLNFMDIIIPQDQDHDQSLSILVPHSTPWLQLRVVSNYRSF